MSENLFMQIPNEIIDEYIFPFIDIKIKILLCKQLYFKYHNYCYKYTHNYLLFIIKKNIRLCCSLLTNYNNFNILEKSKIYFDKKTFYILYDYCIYISNKYKNVFFLQYFKELYKNKLCIDFTKLRIKQYKKFIDKNILWIK